MITASGPAGPAEPALVPGELVTYIPAFCACRVGRPALPHERHSRVPRLPGPAAAGRLAACLPVKAFTQRITAQKAPRRDRARPSLRTGVRPVGNERGSPLSTGHRALPGP